VNRLLWWTASLAFGLAATVAAGSSSEAAGGPGSGFVASAVAAGARVTFTVPNFAVVETVADAGGPVAQAVVDSAGGAQSFASLPYPGETVLAGPGLFATATGISPPSEVPAYVSARHPTNPEAASADPTGSYALSARAVAGRADGDAVAGPVAGHARPSGARSVARSEVDAAGRLRVEARSTMSGLVFGDGTLRIAALAADALATQEPGGETVTSSRLHLDGATVNGVGVAFGPSGLSLVGNPVPLPPTEARRSVDEALDRAGLRVEVIRGAPVPGGVQSDAIEITSTSPSPAPGVPASTMTFRFGGAVAAISSGADLPALPLPVGTDDTVESGPGVPVDSSGPPSPGVPAGGALPEGDQGTVGPATSGRSPVGATGATGGSLRPVPSADGPDGVATWGGVPAVGGEPAAATGPAGGRSTAASAAEPWEEWEPTGLVYLVVVVAAGLVLATPWLWRGKEAAA
jgi:hypothetical protein